MTPARTFAEVQPAEVFERAKTLVPPDAEALVIAGNALRAVGTITALEAELKRPVVTANQGLLWPRYGIWAERTQSLVMDAFSNFSWNRLLDPMLPNTRRSGQAI